MSISCQLVAKLWNMVFISLLAVSNQFGNPKAVYHYLSRSQIEASHPTEPTDPEGDPIISLTSAVLLLVLPIVISWAANLLLHSCVNTDFHKLSIKEKLIHLMSTTWFTLPVRRMGDRDQRHKGREVILGLLLAGLNLAGTSFALERTIQDHSGAFAMLCPVFQCVTVMLKQ